MAWTEGTNHQAMLLGAKIEYGEATLSSNTVEVPTKLTKIYSALYTYKEAPGADTRMICDLAISSDAVTFADSAVAAKTFTYVLIGR